MGRLWKLVNGKRKRTAAGYAHEQAKFKSSAKYKTEQVARVTARRKAIASGRVKKGSSKDVDHIKGLGDGGTNSPSNLRIISRSENRGRRQGSRKRHSGRNRSTWGR